MDIYSRNFICSLAKLMSSTILPGKSGQTTSAFGINLQHIYFINKMDTHLLYEVNPAVNVIN